MKSLFSNQFTTDWERPPTVDTGSSDPVLKQKDVRIV